jgi:hypothetical protein
MTGNADCWVAAQHNWKTYDLSRNYLVDAYRVLATIGMVSFLLFGALSFFVQSQWLEWVSFAGLFVWALFGVLAIRAKRVDLLERI